MVQIQILSDLHLESPKAYDVFEIVPKAPYLALLGDIGVIKHTDEYLHFVRRQLQQFRAVLLVLGNHEAYQPSWPDTLAVIKKFEEEQKGKTGQGQFVLLNRSSFELPSDENGKTIILGCSLFSHVPASRATAVEMGLQNFFQTTDWTIESHNAAHETDLAWLNARIESLAEDDSVSRSIILSHWNPTSDPRATDPRYANSNISSGFASDLSQQSCTTSKRVVM